MQTTIANMVLRLSNGVHYNIRSKAKPFGTAELSNGFIKFSDKLFHQLQFLDNILRTAQFVNTPKHITNVDTNGAVKIFVESNLMT